MKYASLILPCAAAISMAAGASADPHAKWSRDDNARTCVRGQHIASGTLTLKQCDNDPSHPENASDSRPAGMAAQSKGAGYRGAENQKVTTLKRTTEIVRDRQGGCANENSARETTDAKAASGNSASSQDRVDRPDFGCGSAQHSDVRLDTARTIYYRRAPDACAARTDSSRGVWKAPAGRVATGNVEWPTDKSGAISCDRVHSGDYWMIAAKSDETACHNSGATVETWKNGRAVCVAPAGKHFSRVLMQQGRVQLDADVNERR